MRKLRRGDQVQVIAGDEKGNQGSVIRVDREKGRVVVQGINLVYKHIKRSQKYPQGGRIQVEAPIHVSNVMLVDSSEGRPTRVKAKIDNGVKSRVSVRTGNEI